MQKKNKISVTIIMPVYNGLPYIKQQLETILPQLEKEDDILIVDDYSTDGTREYLRGLLKNTNKNIELLENKKNRGISQNIKFLIRNAKSNLIVFSDQDDIWLPNKLEIIRKHFEDPDLSLLVHDAEYICENASNALNGVMAYKYLKTSKSLLRNILRNGYIGCCMAINKTHFPEEIISKIPKVPMHDWFLSSYAILKNKKIKILYQKLIKHRRHSENLTKSNNTLWIKLKQRLSLIRQLLS